MVAARPNTASPDPLSLTGPGPETEDEDLIVVQRVPQLTRPSTPTRKAGVKTPVKTLAGRKRKAQSDEEQDVVPSHGAGGSTLKRNPSKRTKKTVDVPSVSKPRGKAAQALKVVSALPEPENGASSSKTRGDASALLGKGSGSGSGPRIPRKKPIRKEEDPSDLAPKPSSTRKARTPRAAINEEPRSGRKAGRERSAGGTPAEEDEQGSSVNSDSDEDSDEEDAFELDSKTSRTRFLENERRRKLNQARNFVFTGNVHEARKTRSGKTVVVGVEDEIEGDEEKDEVPLEQNEYKEGNDGLEYQQDGEMDIDLGVGIDYTIPEDFVVQEQPLETSNSATTTIINRSVSPFIQEKLNRILSNLSAPPSWNPEPFDTEGKENEALTLLVNLLSGTIERGEGNSCLVVGSIGSGKSRTVNRAIQIAKTASDSDLESKGKSPVVVRLNGLAQTNDMLAIREMGRQIAQQEGQDEPDEEEDTSLVVDASAPTTLPSHLLTFLTTPSARSIIVIIEGFDLFTEHARQALLYCLLDVVQSVRTGPVDSTGRGVAVIGVTSRVDTPLLLEKRVKSRFSQRIFRVVSPLALDGGSAWKSLLEKALETTGELDGEQRAEDLAWEADWQTKIQSLLADESVEKAVSRLCSLTTDPRLLYRPFAQIISDLLVNPAIPITAQSIVVRIQDQTEGTGWGKKLEQLHGLSQPDLVVLIIAKHFSYAGKEEFNFAMAEHEYNRFARTELAASGRTKWSGTTMQAAWEHLLSTGLIFPATRFRPNTNPHMQRFIMCRSLLTRSEIIGFFKGEGGKMLSTELANWGRMAGGHA